MKWEKTREQKDEYIVESPVGAILSTDGRRLRASRENMYVGLFTRSGKNELEHLDLIAMASLRGLQREKDMSLLNNIKKENNKYIREKSNNRERMRKKPTELSDSSEISENFEVRKPKSKYSTVETSHRKVKVNLHAEDENAGKDKTALDYLLEQAEIESQKMAEIERIEQFRRDREQAIRMARMSRRESEDVGHDEIDYLYDGYQIPDDIFKVEYENDNKMYYCPKKNCGKNFPSLSRVKRHYIVHTGKKPYKCLNPDCKKSFSRKDNMLQHYRNHCTMSRRKRFKEYEP
ncbi:Zn-finger [Trachipleistophora hominis]|uniref:Zn-finger n=1 Tax=Trachipleistophora hominis TaxID=72359 RepID=L7JYP3_TRAHO|nr:Zn-finger [Trachipleistophora hominis]